MTNEKVLNYRKAYVELIEIIKVLNEEQRNAINVIIDLIKANEINTKQISINEPHQISLFD